VSEILEEVKLTCLKSWASASQAMRNQGIQKFAESAVQGVSRGKGGLKYDNKDIEAVVDYIKPYKDPATFEFGNVIGNLGVKGTKDKRSKAYAEHLIKVLKTKTFPQGKPPTVVYGPTLTGANYDSKKHVITIDPSKDPGDALDFVLFEIENAVQGKEMREALNIKDGKTRGEAVAELEFVTDLRYVESLKTIYNAHNIEELVVALEIPPELLVAADYQSALQKKEVPMPDKSTLPRQDMRQALWYWKTKGWSDEEKKRVWMASKHGEGVEGTADLYGK